MQQPNDTPMSWDIAYDDAIEVIRTRVHGTFTAAGFKAMMAELLAESARRDHYRILCDCRETDVRMDLSDAYCLPQDLREVGLMSYHMVAVVYPTVASAISIFSFLDDRFYNSGLSQKGFADHDLACLWLTGIDWSIITNPSYIAA
jgi:hypothetical protein